MSKPRDPAIANLENQVEGDIKNASRVVKDIFKAVIGVSNIGKPEIETREPGTKSKRAELEDDGRTITVRAESKSCLTCGGTRHVGRKGHEVECPICGGDKCKTCGGSGWVGAEGHEINCPKCSP